MLFPFYPLEKQPRFCFYISKALLWGGSFCSSDLGVLVTSNKAVVKD